MTLFDTIEEEVKVKAKPQQYQLRPYQEEAVSIAVRHLQGNNKPAIIVAPTGAGKSLYIANIAMRLKGHILVLQPGKELLEQNIGKLKSYDTGLDIGIYSASFKTKEIHKVTFATIGSIYKKVELFKHFDYVLIDECHVVSNSEDMIYNKFLTSLGNKRILGVTATPLRLGRNSYGNILRILCRTKPRIFSDIIHHAQIKTLQDMGFLAPVKYYRIKGFDSSKIRVNSTGMDYVDSSLKKYYADVHFDNSISDVVKRLVNAGRNHVLVFTKFVEDARILVRELGNHAAVVSGDMPKDKRENVLNAFKSGAIKVIVNVGVLVLGFDFPALDTVVIGRPTRSLIFWYQTIGRCVRPFMNKEAWVIDMCDNFSRFPAIDRLWLKKDSMGKWNFYNLDTQLPVTSVYFE